MDKIYEIEKREIPLIPLRGITVFPHMVVHFDVGREKSKTALEIASKMDSEIILCTQKDPSIDDPTIDDYYKIGTIATIKQMINLPGGITRVLVEGSHRGIIKNIEKEEDYVLAEIDEYIYNENIEIDIKMEASIRLIKSKFEEFVILDKKISPEEMITILEVEEPSRLSDLIASLMGLDEKSAHRLIEAFDIEERLEILLEILIDEIELIKIENEIENRVRKKTTKVQREFLLREQMKAIRDELGEDETIDDEVENYKKKIKALELDESSEEKVLKEVDRLLKVAPNSSEIGIIRTYLDWIVELPWNTEKLSEIDIKKAEEVLAKEHYGLEDVKERILEFIAVKKLTETMDGPIICLVGPPGVGKTSIAKSIARAIDRDFVRMSLGGVRDEAEIKGHRRTYVGAMPGKIISSIRRAGSKNPVFLLDEIDKIGSDYRGDPASGLLEVLDPEQNDTFEDHFLDIPFDLSKVLFLTTANTTSTIPAPLLDRMEVIEINSYTEEEKLNIAEKYLLPKQIKKHGLKEENIMVSEQAMRDIINFYTREAGVRNLEREIANLCRKLARETVEEEKESIYRITTANIEKYLGIKKFRLDTLARKDEVGVANGLAWTSVGGTTLSIEVNCMPGKGEVQLTGKLGDVMKESAMAGVSYIRANSNKFGIDENFYKENDIHVHVPEGATPKDGPSAGITIATAVVSALTGVPIDRQVAMTGEVTIRGRVLPVGGVKEKVLAANRLGIKTIIMSVENKKDLEDVPLKIKRNIEFVFVETMDEVLENSLVRKRD